MSFEAFEPARCAMGDTARFARQLNLIEMAPRGKLSSTGFVMANEGREYVVLQPTRTTDPFTVTLERGTYQAEWFSIEARETLQGDPVSVDAPTALPFPIPSPARAPVVLILRRMEPGGPPPRH